MSDGLAWFNALPRDDAERRLYFCFANRPWAVAVAGARPYQDVDELLAAAESAWANLAPPDWLESFAAHPRIGERGGDSPASSEREQALLRQAPTETLAALAAENRRYEARFGHVFLIAAAGRSPDEILATLRRRLNNAPDEELAVASGEHRKITRLRLERLLDEPHPPASRDLPRSARGSQRSGK
ncbi:MAG: 2-oxo-4-hydroxy-4-carboxy-5-ureidoimidazoline decarboxylase [Candidatus Dormiibacterota bacterium]